ncbi:hypothetical protein BRADI_4g27892v3 [Brachypodium distachyon]|uniref:RRM domain-containing protein n=1 Tax=Brachypodium distachyon TaxID=15368 RepID=A0A2K2CQN8_BRADI|nr:hypothetical protein BRADI_4g27892v3 [Brachypodium distachyon]
MLHPISDDASAALHLKGVTIGDRHVKVAPSRTAIMHVNPSFLAQSDGEKEMCSRTVYCTNIEKSVTCAELVGFFQAYFGSVSRVRLLGDDNHVTGIAFVEFAEVLISKSRLSGCTFIRVSPSKTPIRN